MSENENITEAFDLWLAEGLKRPQHVTPEFERNLVRQVERLAALRMLRKVAWQKRICGWAVLLVVAGGLGALCYPPVLMAVYAGAKHVLEGFILVIAKPSKGDLTATALVAACLVVLAGAMLDRFLPQP